METVSFITLGCSKNTVDTNMMSELLSQEGYFLEDNPRKAKYVIINTCGFIDAAKEESIDVILEAAGWKKEGTVKKVILAGCLAERYKDQLLSEIPEVDAILGTGSIASVVSLIRRLKKENHVIEADDINSMLPEIHKTKGIKWVEYVKIAEGCNNNCSYCIIPKLRGRNRSRKIEEIRAEVENLLHNKTKEIVLIAQNSTDYGIDRYHRRMLTSLLQELDTIKGDYWIRVMYMYPDGIDEELIDFIASSKHILPYFDIPIQHVSDSVLHAMKRKTSRLDLERIIKSIRERIPHAVLRTTLIVGFPGETEEDFNELCSFITKNSFQKLGVFPYSREEDTEAYDLPEQVNEEIKEQRRNRVMELQAEVSEELLKQNVDRVLTVLIEEKADSETYVGRSYQDAEEIDGVVYVHSQENLSLGTFVRVKITDSMEYDLIGEALK